MKTAFARLAIVAMSFSVVRASAQVVESAPPVIVITEQYASYSVTELSIPVGSAKVHPCTPKLGDRIEVLAIDFDLWIDHLRKGRQLATKQEREPTAEEPSGRYAFEGLIPEILPRLRLILDGKAMTSLAAENPSLSWAYGPGYTDPISADAPEKSYFSVQFRLRRDRDNEKSKADWKDILKQSSVRIPMDVTLGMVGEDGRALYAIQTGVQRKAEDVKQRFEFRRIPWDRWTATGAFVLLGAFALFVYLAVATPILRDQALPPHPDGLSPVSLGRCQMAFWFFFVAGAFLFLWLVTGRGDFDTIPDGTLVLLGISAGTAVGAAFLRNEGGDAAHRPVVNYREEIAAAKERLLALKIERGTFARGDGRAALLAANSEEVEKATATLRKATQNLAEYRRTHRHQFLMDMLSEDGRTVTFHRFQVVVWTLVLAVVFLSEVLTRLAMPNFNTTLLLLMGISSGTFLGFKAAPGKPKPAS